MTLSKLKTFLTVCLALVFGAWQASCACALADATSYGSAPAHEHASHVAPSPASHLSEHGPEAPGAPDHRQCSHCGLMLLIGKSAKSDAFLAPLSQQPGKTGAAEIGVRGSFAALNAHAPIRSRWRSAPPRPSLTTLKIRLLN